VPIVNPGSALDPALAAAAAASQVSPGVNPGTTAFSATVPAAASPTPAVTAGSPPGNGGGRDSFGLSLSCQFSPVTGGAMVVPSETPTGATSSFSLAQGTSFTLEAAGDVQVSDTPRLRGDTQFQDFASPRSMSSDGTVQVGLKVVGASVAASHPIWGKYRGDHIYRLQVTGQGTPIRIYYSDSAGSYSGHHGVFSVRVLGGSGSGPQDAVCPGGVATRTCKDCGCSGGSAPTPAGTGTGGPSDHWRMSNQVPGSSDSMSDQAPGSCTGPSNSDVSSAGGIRYFDGGVDQSMRDLVSGGFGHIFGFGHGWSNLGLYGDATSSIGPGGSVSQQPYLDNIRGDSSVIGVLSAIGGTADWFEVNAQGQYVPVFFEENMLFHDATSHLFTFVDALGNSLSFFDFDATAWPTNMQGQLTLAYDPYGADPVGHQFHKTQVIRDRMTGAVTEIVRTDPNAAAPLSESYLYTYQGANLQKVVQRRGPDSSSYQTVRVLVLTYYPGGTSGGNAGNLESATVCNPDDALLRTSSTTMAAISRRRRPT
jgi:hypothetical protein